MAAFGAIVPVRRRQNRLFRPRADLETLRDFEVLSRYRLTRPAIFQLEDLLRPHLERATRRSSPIPVLTQVLVGLRYLAKGDFLSEVADIHGISRSSACHIIINFVDAINATLDNIKFPDQREQAIIKREFYRKCRIPNTVGAIDGTLIPIQAPTVDEHVYVCRKNFHAINVQAVVDHRGRFTDVVSRWPGSTHDASIFENSGLKMHLEEQRPGHLLGDSGYPLRRYLLTPLLRPQTRQETLYNNAQSSGRMVVERTFGLLKARFRCLHRTGGCIAMTPGKCCRVSVACMRLHNLCVDMGVPGPEPVEEEEEEEENPHQEEVGPANNYRLQIIGLF